jgi:hypothetical protein
MENSKNTGITTGVVVGFLFGLLTNMIVLPIAIGVGGLFDYFREKKNK